MKTIAIALCIGALALLGGCNAVYFYETDKVSLTVEARPDSTGPVQGNFGFKQRVVAFVPKRNGGKPTPSGTAFNTLSNAPAVRIEKASAEASAKNPNPTTLADRAKLKRDFLDALADQSESDAMDVLSALRFHKLPKPEGAPWYRISHMTIDTALITGGAARHVANPGQALAALSGTPFAAGPQKRLALRGVYDTLRQAARDDKNAAAHVRDLDSLAARLPATYPFNRYAPSGDPASSDLTTDEKTRMGNPVKRQDFDDVLSYWGALATAEQRLAKLPDKFKLDGVEVDEAKRQQLANELKTVRSLLDGFEKTIAGSAAVHDAAAYFAKGI